MYLVLPAFRLHMEPDTHQHLLALELTLTSLNRSANVYTNRSARVSVTSVKLRSFGMFAAMARTYSHYGKSGVDHQL